MADLPMQTQLSSSFEDEIFDLTVDLTELGILVESMLQDAINALKRRDLGLAREVIMRDQKANALQKTIDEDALIVLGLNDLQTGALRRVIGTGKIANDLERVGDLAEGIARRITHLETEDFKHLTQGVERMGRQVIHQLHRVLDALTSDNALGAIDVWLHESEIDELYNSVFRELLTQMMKEPRNIATCTTLLAMAKNLERIGDHSTSIAEAIYFTINGTPLINDPAIVKHQPH